jgi:hypothetical protein
MEVMQLAGSVTLGNNEPYDASAGGRGDKFGTPLSGSRNPPGQALSGAALHMHMHHRVHDIGSGRPPMIAIIS